MSHLTPIQQVSLAVLLHAACASISTTTTTTTTRDRGDCYGPMEWAQLTQKPKPCLVAFYYDWLSLPDTLLLLYHPADSGLI